MNKIAKEKTDWGFKAILVSRKEYASSILIILEGEQTQYMYHKKRDKTWAILQGVIQFTIEGRTQLLNEGDNVHIPAKIMHKATAIKGDATIMEVGTCLLDDEVIVG